MTLVYRFLAGLRALPSSPQAQHLQMRRHAHQQQDLRSHVLLLLGDSEQSTSALTALVAAQANRYAIFALTFSGPAPQSVRLAALDDWCHDMGIAKATLLTTGGSVRDTLAFARVYPAQVSRVVAAVDDQRTVLDAIGADARPSRTAGYPTYYRVARPPRGNMYALLVLEREKIDSEVVACFFDATLFDGQPLLGGLQSYREAHEGVAAPTPHRDALGRRAPEPGASLHDDGHSREHVGGAVLQR